MNKITLSTIVLFAATGAAFAHPGHTEEVAGHTHSLLDLALMSAGPIVLAVAAIAYFAIKRGKQS